MEIGEAVKRILWHYKLLILLVGLGALFPLAFLGGGQRTYEASTRLVVATDTEAAGAADSVAAIATSESQIRAALAQVNLDRDPGSVADRVSVTSIGSSGIVQLSVADRNPLTAVLLAKSLADQVTQVMETSGLTAAPLPYVVDTASLSTTRATSPDRVQDVALGALVGLLLGILTAAVVEALTPTLIGEDVIAAELRTSVLAVIRDWPDVPDHELAWASWQVSAGAKRVHVRSVEVTSVDRGIDVLPLSESLTPPSSAPRGTVQPPRLQAFDLDGHPPVSANGSVGLVIATPPVLKRSRLEPVREFIGVTGWPVIGIIAIEPKGVVSRVQRAMQSLPRRLASRPRVRTGRTS